MPAVRPGLLCFLSRLKPGLSSYLGKGPAANRALVPCGAARLSANLDDAPPNFMEDPMRTGTRARLANVPGYYLGRSAAFWLTVLAPRRTGHK